jgi:outer membrane protein OmpA-like peptidoglycan-associated protein
LMVLLLAFGRGQAQDTKPKNNSFDIEAFKANVEAMAKKEKESKGNGNTTTRRTYGAGSNLKESYNRLSDEDKALVKDLPIPPDPIRTADQAQDFESKLQGKDLMKMINTPNTSMLLKMYLVNYQGIHQKTMRIVQEAARAKAKFQRENPNINFGEATSKVYVCKNDIIFLPLGDASFADEVVSATYGSGDIKFPEKNSLSTPDYVEMPNRRENKGVYSLGLGGTLVIKFTNNALVDVKGTDLYVFEMGQVEPTNLDISTDGNTWLSVGSISGGVAEVDISKVAKPNEYYYYVRLTDLKSSSSIPGADVDAVAAIGAAMRMSLNAEVLFDFGKAELKTEGVAAIKKLASQLTGVQKATINIAGYTDDIGGDEANRKLSLTRAESVSKILQQELDNSKFVFKTKGLGKQNPVSPNDNEENRKKNRRVEILVSPF